VNNSLRQKLEATFKDIRTAIPQESRITVTAENHSILAILRFLKDAGFDHLALVSAVDHIEDNEFELCYILTCYTENRNFEGQSLHIILKTRISREEPNFQTITGIYPNAEPYEREIHELFGIKFEGHPRLTPLLLERDYDIPPFRKDFDTRKYVKDLFDNIPSIEIEKK
jgi:NADH-quinone oxidoreductase subunit C